jgi:hypothetical protein
MSVKWDVLKTSGQQQKSEERGPIFIRQFVSLYKHKYFIVFELRYAQFKQKQRFQGYSFQNITSLFFMT